MKAKTKTTDDGYKPTKYEIHPAANKLPLMPKPEFDDLVADIKAHGQLQPIVMKGDLLVDGRHRMMACEELKLAPRTIQFDDVDEFKGKSIEDVVVANNVLRRHLHDEDQRVALIAQIRGEELTKAAKGRMAAARSKKNGEKAPRAKAREELAKEAKTTTTKARQALETFTHAPEELEKVAKGQSKLVTAAKAAAKKRKQKAAASGKTTTRAKKLPTIGSDEWNKDVILKFRKNFLERYWAVTNHPAVKAVIRGYITEK